MQPPKPERPRVDATAIPVELREQRSFLSAPTDESDPARPTIVLSPDISGVVAAAEDALIAADAAIYQRAGALVRITSASHTAKDGIGRHAETAVIGEMPMARLREMMSASARWQKIKANDDRQDVLPPEYAATTLAARGDWRFPVLNGVIATPTLRPDGSMLTEPGYDRKTGLFLVEGTPLEIVPESPTLIEARAACESLIEPFCDFPFRQDSDTAATLAALLTTIARPAIDGAIPMFVVTAPIAGSGKSKLVDALSLITTGEVACRMADARDDDETRKRLFAIAIAGDSFVLIDNVERPFASPALCAAITGRSIGDRVLGQSVVRKVPLNTVFFATGNNLRIRGDLARRVVPIRLDPQTDNPEGRAGFRYRDLEAHLRRERARLVRDALVVLRAFIVAGRPESTVAPYGSFEAWDALIRHAVAWVMDVDPLQGRDELKTDDSERDALLMLLMAWQDASGSGKTHAKTVSDALNEGGANLRNALAAICNVDAERLIARSVGIALGRYKDRIIRVDTDTRLVLRRGDRDTSGHRWFVETVPV